MSEQPRIGKPNIGVASSIPSCNNNDLKDLLQRTSLTQRARVSTVPYSYSTTAGDSSHVNLCAELNMQLRCCPPLLFPFRAHISTSELPAFRNLLIDTFLIVMIHCNTYMHIYIYPLQQFSRCRALSSKADTRGVLANARDSMPKSSLRNSVCFLSFSLCLC